MQKKKAIIWLFITLIMTIAFGMITTVFGAESCPTCGGYLNTVDNNDGTHRIYCTNGCGYSYTRAHSWEKNYRNAGTFHYKKCSVCSAMTDRDVHHFATLNSSQKCVCGETIKVSSGFDSLSEWSGYTPGDPGISGPPSSTVTVTVNGKVDNLTVANCSIEYYTAHTSEWHSNVAKKHGMSESVYFHHLRAENQIRGGGTIQGTINNGTVTSITFEGVPTSGRVHIEVRCGFVNWSKRYTDGSDFSTDPGPNSEAEITIRYVKIPSGSWIDVDGNPETISNKSIGEEAKLNAIKKELVDKSGKKWTYEYTSVGEGGEYIDENTVKPTSKSMTVFRWYKENENSKYSTVVVNYIDNKTGTVLKSLTETNIEKGKVYHPKDKIVRDLKGTFGIEGNYKLIEDKVVVANRSSTISSMPESINVDNDFTIEFYYDDNEQLLLKYFVRIYIATMRKNKVVSIKEVEENSYDAIIGKMITVNAPVREEKFLGSKFTKNAIPFMSASVVNSGLSKDSNVKFILNENDSFACISFVYVNELPNYDVTINYIDDSTGEVLKNITESEIEPGSVYYPRNKIVYDLKGTFNINGDYKLIESKVDFGGNRCTIYSLPIITVINDELEINFYYNRIDEANYYVRVFTVTQIGGMIMDISCISDESKSVKINNQYTVSAPGVVGNYIGYRIITNGTKPVMKPNDIRYLAKGSTVTFTLTKSRPVACIDFVYLIKSETPSDEETGIPEGSSKAGLEYRAEVKLRSNSRDNEEYNVDVAIPTSEDLYANILPDGFILEWSKLEKVSGNGTVSLSYQASYEDWEYVYESIYNEKEKKWENVQQFNNDGTPKVRYYTAYYTPTYKSERVNYAYWRPTGASLYKINDSTISNSVLENSPVSILPSSGYDVSLNYSTNGGLFNNTKTIYVGYYSDYSSAKSAADSAMASSGDGEWQALRYGNIVRMGTLSASGSQVSGLYTILDGSAKTIEDSLKYKPVIPESAPKTNRDVLYKNKDLFVKIIGNSSYGTTGTIKYVKKTSRGNISTPNSYTFNLTGNSVNVHTPVVNYTELDLFENNKYNQLIPANENVVVIGHEFKVKILNNGQHIVANGYGNRNYNTSGVRNDVNNKKNKEQHFAIEKWIEFDKVGVVYNGVYHEAGKAFKLASVSDEVFNFIIPEWEKEIWNYGTVKMTTKVVAENGNINSAYEKNANKNSNNYVAIDEKYIKVVGEIADLEIIGTNDPGWSDIKEVITTHKMPIGQSGQNTQSAYKYGLKLGYQAYFDMKAIGYNGQKSNTVSIKPSYYYVSKNGGTAEKVDLYYHYSSTERYVKLDTKPINISMTMSNSYGTKFKNVFGFTEELTSALKQYTTKYNYTQSILIGNSTEVQLSEANRLPYVKAINEMKSKYSFSISAPDNEIGHWYGAIRIPSSSLAVKAGTTNVKSTTTFKNNGYILVVFDSVITRSDGVDYLSYSKGVTNWPIGGTKTITLPNGKSATVPDGTAVIYESDIRANNDYEISGTH